MLRCILSLSFSWFQLIRLYRLKVVNETERCGGEFRVFQISETDCGADFRCDRNHREGGMRV